MTEAAVPASPEPVAAGERAAPNSSARHSPAVVRTEFPFTLPRGYADSEGRLHRDGVMRLATARDELIPLKDQRVQENPAYLSVVLLGRLIPRLGTLTDVHAGIIEGMFAADLAFLQRFYEKINSDGTSLATTACPECSHEFRVDLGSGLGE